MVIATLRKNLGPSMPKHRKTTHVFRKTKSRTQDAFFVSCQIDVNKNKQHFIGYKSGKRSENFLY